MDLDTVVCEDALTLLRSLEPQSVDAIISDFPYGTTAAAWDVMPDLPALWEAIKHALKPQGVVVTTASQPFTSMLVMSNIKWFRYEWIWEKTMAMGYLNANRMPMKEHENIVIFYAEGGAYYPQMAKGKPYRATSGAVGGVVRDKTVGGYITENNGERYPRSVLDFASVKNTVHPTQKPVALYEYLILTYTQAGALVVDPYCGSGTTCIAARNTGRHYIGGALSPDYVAIARKRLALPYTVPMFD